MNKGNVCILLLPLGWNSPCYEGVKVGLELELESIFSGRGRSCSHTKFVDSAALVPALTVNSESYQRGTTSTTYRVEYRARLIHCRAGITITHFSVRPAEHRWPLSFGRAEVKPPDTPVLVMAEQSTRSTSSCNRVKNPQPGAETGAIQSCGPLSLLERVPQDNVSRGAFIFITRSAGDASVRGSLTAGRSGLPDQRAPASVRC